MSKMTKKQSRILREEQRREAAAERNRANRERYLKEKQAAEAKKAEVKALRKKCAGIKRAADKAAAKKWREEVKPVHVQREFENPAGKPALQLEADVLAIRAADKEKSPGPGALRDKKRVKNFKSSNATVRLTKAERREEKKVAVIGAKGIESKPRGDLKPRVKNRDPQVPAVAEHSREKPTPVLVEGTLRKVDAVTIQRGAPDRAEKRAKRKADAKERREWNAQLRKKKLQAKRDKRYAKKLAKQQVEMPKAA